MIRSQSQEPEPEPEARARSHELEQKSGETKAGSAVRQERQEVETMELKSSESEAGEDEMDPRRSDASSQILRMCKFSCSTHHLVLCAYNTVL